jgi:hypothetical protein
MESFFATLISASFFFSFVAGEKAATFGQGCEASPLHVMASLRNAETLTDAPLAPFGRPEQGWQVYAPQVAATIGTRCAPHTPRFAASLARWQARHGLSPSGAVTEGTLAALKARWQKARPFIANFEPGSCPPPDGRLDGQEGATRAPGACEPAPHGGRCACCRSPHRA